MAWRTLEITLISAKDLKGVNLFSRMEVYAVASISGDPRSRQRTPADREGRRNPTWNHALRFAVPANDPGHLALHVLLRTERTLGDRDVGEVHVPLRDLLSNAAAANAPQFLSYQVRRPVSGRAKGVLYFSYKLDGGVPALAPAPAPAKSAGAPVAAYPFGPNVADAAAASPYPPPSKAGKVDEPVTAYPAAYPPPGPYPVAPYPPPPAGYPPYQQQPYGYPPPAGQGGYGYPPAGYGYGAPAPAAAPVRNNMMGMGMGIGAGLLGGMLLGDMMSDASAYDAGYDAGFDDGSSFGF